MKNSQAQSFEAQKLTRLAYRAGTPEAHQTAADAHEALAFDNYLSNTARGRHMTIADKHRSIIKVLTK